MIMMMIVVNLKIYCEDLEMSYSVILKNKRTTKETMTNCLALALDKCKVGDRDAVYVLIAWTKLFNANVNDYAMNLSSIKRSHDNFRCQIASEIKTSMHK